MRSGQPSRPRPVGRTLGGVALGLALCLTTVAASTAAFNAPARSQELATPLAGTPTGGTPAAGGLPLSPVAAECTVAPVPFAELTPVAPIDPAGATPTPAPDVQGGGTPASPEQVASVIATLRLQIACLNAGDIPRALALTGGAYYERLFARTGTPDEAEYAVLATPLPRSAETAITVLAVEAVVALPDGSLRADVTTGTIAITVNTVTLAAAPSSPTRYVIVDQRQLSRVTPTPEPDA